MTGTALAVPEAEEEIPLSETEQIINEIHDGLLAMRRWPASVCRDKVRASLRRRCPAVEAGVTEDFWSWLGS